MRVSREQAALNRARIVEVAARLFREKGYDGIGVADLMKGAGLTHGGFYGHFDSKEDLLAEACAKALEGSVERWQRIAEQNSPQAALDKIAHSYLSPDHRDHPGLGCSVTALGADIARLGQPAREALTGGVKGQLAVLEKLLPGDDAAERRRAAVASYAAMVGAMVLARAVEDPALSEEFMQVTMDAVLGQASLDS